MQPSANKFRVLRVEGWRQFGGVEIELHPRLTILTGANGAGKSSLLRIFNHHFGFNRPFLATPMRKSDGGYAYLTGLFSGALAKVWSSLLSPRRQSGNQVGTLEYTNSIESVLHVPERAGIQYEITVPNRQHVAGIHIDSHQPISPFQQVQQIPTNILNPSKIYGIYNTEVINRYSGAYSGFSPTYRMKEALLSMAMFGEGNKYVEGDQELLDAYRGFIDALKKILPETLGFMDISIRPPEVVLVTKSGEFLIDASSGGVMTLIDLTWQLHMFSLTQNEFVVTIDEPENHLHPTMQRLLMRRLLAAFPQVQFIIATHSPFMVSSVQDSNVYVLRYVDSVTGAVESEQIMPSHTSRVISERLDTINKAGTASEILRNVLGVSATIPEWVEEGLNTVVAQYRERPITQDTLRDLRRELASLGYDELYPDALATLTEGR